MITLPPGVRDSTCQHNAVSHGAVRTCDAVRNIHVRRQRALRRTAVKS